MKNKKIFTSYQARLVASLSLFAAFAGCASERSSSYRGYSHVEADFQDDYDYFPEYETYYSYRRREFVYFDGGIWVRRPAPPRGISVNVILAAPSVRLDFHDAPERHHTTVVRSYPRTWRGPDTNHPVNRERPNDQPERHVVRPESPAVTPERRHDRRDEEHHEATPERSDVKPTPPEPKPEHRPNKPNPPGKKKVAPKEEHPEDKSDEKKEDRKHDRKDDNRGPNR